MTFPLYIANEASLFLIELIKKRKKYGVRIGYDEKSTWGKSRFKLTLDELNHGDFVEELNGLTFIYGKEVESHIHRLQITYESGRLLLYDTDSTR